MKGRWKDHSPTATGLLPVSERGAWTPQSQTLLLSRRPRAKNDPQSTSLAERRPFFSELLGPPSSPGWAKRDPQHAQHHQACDERRDVGCLQHDSTDRSTHEPGATIRHTVCQPQLP